MFGFGLGLGLGLEAQVLGLGLAARGLVLPILCLVPRGVVNMTIL